MNRTVSLLFVLLALVVQGPVTLAVPKKPPELLSAKIVMEKWPGDLHPTRSVTLEAVLIGNQVYEPLVTIGPSGDIQPILLKSWNYDAAHRRFYFQLKSDIHFSNGELLTSKQVLQAFQRVIAENRVKNFSRIKGAKAFLRNRARHVEGLQFISLSEFSIQLEIDYPRFLMDLADPYASVFIEPSKETLPLGTGPYAIKEQSLDPERITLIRNPRAPQAPGSFDELEFGTDPSADADIYFAKPVGPRVDTLRSEYLDTEVLFLGFNTTNPKLRNLQLRRFLASLLTRELVDGNLGRVPYKVGGYIPLGLAGHDPDLSVQPLSAPTQSVPMPVFPKSLVLTNYMKTLEPLAQQYCHAVSRAGIRCTVRSTTGEDLFKEKSDGTLELFFLRQKSTTYSLEYLLSCFTSESPFNLFTSNGPLNRQMDRMFETMLETPNDGKNALVGLYKQMDQLILNQVLVKPFRYGINKSVWFKNNLNFPTLNTLGPFGLKLREVTLKE